MASLANSARSDALEREHMAIDREERQRDRENAERREREERMRLREERIRQEQRDTRERRMNTMMMLAMMSSRIQGTAASMQPLQQMMIQEMRDEMVGDGQRRPIDRSNEEEEEE